MRKILFFAVLFLLTVHFSHGQKRTIIYGIIKDCQDCNLDIKLLIIDGMSAIRTSQEYSTVIKKGNFYFDFPLQKTSTATIYLKNDLAFSPGTFSIVVNPGDSLHFTVPSASKLGLINMNIGGMGSEKIILFRDVIKKINSSRIFKKTYSKQTVTEKYLEVDRSLDIIDSVFQNLKRPHSIDHQLVHAQLVDQALDMILIHSLQNKSDSTLFLFNKYILKKKRIVPLLNRNSIEYFGGFRLIPNYMSLLNRINGGQNLNRFADPSEYNSLIVKEFKRVSYIRDYLLSDLALQIFEQHWNDKVSKNMFDFYISHVNKKEYLYKRVVDEFKHVELYLQPGKPFFKFALPDTTGKVHKLEDFKGKIVVLDFWFTGCAGCKDVSPVLAKIEEEMENDSIQFVSINVDNMATWKLGIGEYSSKNSLQLYTEEQRFDHPIIKFAKIPAYPTLVVLDKQGNLIGIAPNPVSHLDEFKEYIQKQL